MISVHGDSVDDSISTTVAIGWACLDFAGKLIFNISSHGCHGVEIVQTQICRFDLDTKIGFNELDDFDDIQRVDEAGGKQAIVGRE